jgi:hypothetical protein
MTLPIQGKLISYLLVVIDLLNFSGTLLTFPSDRPGLLVYPLSLLTEDLSLDLVPLGLGLLIVRVELEQVALILTV